MHRSRGRTPHVTVPQREHGPKALNPVTSIQRSALTPTPSPLRADHSEVRALTQDSVIPRVYQD